MTDTIINKHNENKNTAGNITKRRRHPVYTIIALTALLIISAFLSIMLGSVQLKPADIMRCLTGSDKSSVTYVLIMNIRLPRMIGAIVAGMGLSVAGVILQSVMNNALASPNTIGVNSGAGFFVMLSMILFPHSANASSFAAFVAVICGLMRQQPRKGLE